MAHSPLLDDRRLRSALDLRDLTDPVQGPHALQLLLDDAVASLARAAHLVVDVRCGDRVVSTADNYDNLGYEHDAVSRDARYTKYLDSHHVLRSHTSALIPPALRSLRGTNHDDVLIVAPGVCYRRDSIDWQHTGNPHQVDLWRIRRNDRHLDIDDLVAMIVNVVTTVLPGARWRTVPSAHPYTDQGRQVDAYWNGQWVEIGECGLAATHVLDRAGLGEEWTGLAMGVGLDRLLMLRKGVPDIRLLRSADARIATQMLDLAPYRGVSTMPPIVRDISVATGSHDIDDEAIGDQIRDTLGDQADLVETVSVIQRTSYDDVPPTARRRLGIEAGQHNLLIRVVLRAMDRTLTNPEANQLRDLLHAALHQGAS